MKALIKLHLKENRKKNTFFIFGILGALLTLIVTGWVTFSTNTIGSSTSDYTQYGFQWTFLTLIAAFATVSLSMTTMDKHRQGNFAELLQVHGLSRSRQYLARAWGNTGVAVLMATILLGGMLVSLVIKKPEFNLLGLVVAVANYLVSAGVMALLVSLLTLVFPSAVAGLLAILMTVLGAMRGILDLLVQNRGGLFAQVGLILLKLVPPLNAFGQVSRDLFFGELKDWRPVFENGFYLWALIGLLYLVCLGVAKNEK